MHLIAHPKCCCRDAIRQLDASRHNTNIGQIRWRSECGFRKFVGASAIYGLTAALSR
jgi:hypothetical protein